MPNATGSAGVVRLKSSVRPRYGRAGLLLERQHLRDGRGVGRGHALHLEGEDDAEPLALVGDAAQEHRVHAERRADEAEAEPRGDLELRAEVVERLVDGHRAPGTAEQVGVDAERDGLEAEPVDRVAEGPLVVRARPPGSRARPGGR